jgi:hypothetical protein
MGGAPSRLAFTDGHARITGRLRQVKRRAECLGDGYARRRRRKQLRPKLSIGVGKHKLVDRTRPALDVRRRSEALREQRPHPRC